jgi:hypothetical protein
MWYEVFHTFFFFFFFTTTLPLSSCIYIFIKNKLASKFRNIRSTLTAQQKALTTTVAGFGTSGITIKECVALLQPESIDDGTPVFISLISPN